MAVSVPQFQKKNEMGQIGQVAGAIGGAIIGGPAGAITGAGVGSQLGNFAEQASGPQGASPGAIERRSLAQGADPKSQIAASQQALTQMPPDVQKEYGPILRRAQQMA